MALHRVSFIHASPAAIAPLMRYCGQAEPEWEVTNLLDDGVMRSFRQGDAQAAESGLLSLILRARSRYCAEAALVTCSAASVDLIRRLSAASGLPLVKIDAPMAEAAVRAGTEIGVLATFPPTLQPTRAVLREAARQAERVIHLRTELCEQALEALLAGDSAAHDEALAARAQALLSAGAEVLVLAQVSMAHLRETLQSRLGVPVFSSLETSHRALRGILEP